MHQATFRSFDVQVLAGVETTPGTKQTLTPAANAVRTYGQTEGWNFEDISDPEENRGVLDVPGPEIGGGNAELGFRCALKGSGVGGTPPEFDALLRGCGFQATALASAEADMAASSGPDSIGLGANASSVDGFYVGMAIYLTIGPGAGQKNVITAYDGSSKTATVAWAWATAPEAMVTFYDIPPNVLYRPASLDQETVTIQAFDSANESAEPGRLVELYGAMGTMSLDIPLRGRPVIQFTFTGIPEEPVEAARPTGLVLDGTNAIPFLDAMVALGAPGGGAAAVALSQISADLGSTVQQPDNPAAKYGFDYAQQTARQITGSFQPRMDKPSVRNPVRDFITSTAQGLWAVWGGSSGNRVALSLPSVTYTSTPKTDVNGYAHQDVAFGADSADNGLVLCFH